MLTPYDHDFWLELGINYSNRALRLARLRGWDGDAHLDAVLAMDDDAIALTHPFNHLTEREVEVETRL